MGVTKVEESRLIEWDPESSVRVLGIDPGVGATGLCLIDNDFGSVSFQTVRTSGVQLMERALQISHAVRAMARRGLDLMVIEHMQVYRQSKQRGDPNDLIDIAFVAGVAAAHGSAARYELPRPAQWKGNLTKEIHHSRLQAKLTRIPRVSEHAWDAFGLALYGLERLEMHGLT